MRGLREICVGLIAMLAWSPARADGQEFQRSDQAIKVKLTPAAADDQGLQTFRLDLEIARGWYVYANPPTVEQVKGNETVVKVYAAGKLLEAQIRYPEGTLKKEVDENNKPYEYRVYQDKATIQVRLKSLADPAPALEFAVRVNACDGNVCLPQGTRKLKLP